MSNITLPKNYGCDLAKQSSVGKTILTSSREVTDGSSNDDVELVNYHRHCQATVLSAYGIKGEGATWNQIFNLKDSLPNLSTDWINEFMVDGNVTDDFVAILKILNSSIGNVKGDIGEIQKGKMITLTTKVGNSGKFDQRFVFDTVKTNFPGENLTITLPDIKAGTGLKKNDDTIQLKPATQDEIGGVKVGNDSGLIVDQDGNIDIKTNDNPKAVTKIKQGHNISISPSSGVGEVTINNTFEQQQSDWNAIEGPTFIRNKPTKLSSFVNDIHIKADLEVIQQSGYHMIKICNDYGLLFGRYSGEFTRLLEWSVENPFSEVYGMLMTTQDMYSGDDNDSYENATYDQQTLNFRVLAKHATSSCWYCAFGRLKKWITISFVDYDGSLLKTVIGLSGIIPPYIHKPEVTTWKNHLKFTNTWENSKYSIIEFPSEDTTFKAVRSRNIRTVGENSPVSQINIYIDGIVVKTTYVGRTWTYYEFKPESSNAKLEIECVPPDGWSFDYWTYTNGTSTIQDIDRKIEIEWKKDFIDNDDYPTYTWHLTKNS